jgi:hypothetical protein
MLRAAERSPQSMIRFPRLSVTDDATALLFAPEG